MTLTVKVFDTADGTVRHAPFDLGDMVVIDGRVHGIVVGVAWDHAGFKIQVSTWISGVPVENSFAPGRLTKAEIVNG